ncbi:MAG: hydroxyethylthiazole kinase [Clostridia bacterium]|nr:hydroxyethylthiazole kinase [Clostridia bacterium]
MEEALILQISRVLDEVRRKKPLIHHITNYVTVNDCANIVLAIGASPIMADDIGEAEAIAAISSALVLNIGTLNGRTLESMLAAGKKANACHIPVVLDPVGAGASELRNRATERLLHEVRVSVLLGNLSEIRFAAGLNAATKGVDVSDADLESGAEISRATAEKAARELGCVAAVTGATDMISDGSRTLAIRNGVRRLSAVTGTGCMCTSLVGTFCGATDDCLIAAAGGVLSMGIAGELAEESAGGRGNGSFHIAIIDAVSGLSADILAGRAKIDEA